jgi:hypothetical protein
MSNEGTILWALIAMFLIPGVGLLFAKIDDRQVQKLKSLNRFFPAIRLYQFRAFRYGAAVVCFIMAGVVYFQLPS